MGLQHTACYFMNRPVDNLAIGYISDTTVPGGWRKNIYDHVMRGGPAGGGFSTAHDLHRFALALTAGKLVDQASRDLLWTDAAGADYGCGFSLGQTQAGAPIIGHSGGFPGISSNLDVFLKSGYIVCVLSNYGGVGGRTSAAIRRLVGRVAE
jgi:CubicO group peptidase (beta-lactamase class C family)